MKKRSKWYKLDNAAKIYPPSKSSYDPKIFRFTCEIKENVNKRRLQDALDKTLLDFPLFNSEMKTGFFWHYLEISNLKAFVREEKNAPCSILNTDLLFEVTYFKNRINLEVSHALSDGSGTLEFMKTLITNYFLDKTVINDSSTTEKEKDSFDTYYNDNQKIIKSRKKKALQIKGQKYPENRIKIIEGKMNIDKIKNLAKSNNATLTMYITALLISSIEKNLSLKEKKKSIIVMVPIDLRKRFPSKTIRNFFNVINIEYKCQENNSFDIILEEVKKQFNQELNLEKISSNMKHNSWLEKLIFIRLVPIFIKDIVLKIFHKCSKYNHTITLSNLGAINLPEDIQNKINVFDVVTSTEGIKVCMISYKNNLTISFSSHFIDSEIEKNFFKELSKITTVEINTNKVGEENE